MQASLCLFLAVSLSFLSGGIVRGQQAGRKSSVQAATVSTASFLKEEKSEATDLQALAYAWYQRHDPADIPAMDAALSQLLPTAIRQSVWVTKLPSWDEARQSQSYHNAGAILLAKCYTLIQADRAEEAAESIRLLNEKLPHALMVSGQKVVWQVRKMVRYHEHESAIRVAVKDRKMETFTFQPERDEFDAWAQKQTVEDLAMLQLRAGDFDSLEYLSEQARVRELKTPAGHWISDSIYAGMHPAAEETKPETWTEITERIQAWKTKKPGSINAKIGEALLTLYQLKALMESGKDVIAARVKAVSELETIGTLAPQIPLVRLVFSLLQQESLESTAAIFKEAHDKFPTYTPILVITLLRLTSEPNGHDLCIGVLNVIGESAQPEQLALALAALPPSALPPLSRGLKMSHVRRSLRTALQQFSGSEEMRNSLAVLATRMSQQDLAQEAMSTIGQRWDRLKWKGLEDQAVRLTEPRNLRPGQVTRPASRSLKTARAE